MKLSDPCHARYPEYKLMEAQAGCVMFPTAMAAILQDGHQKLIFTIFSVFESLTSLA